MEKQEIIKDAYGESYDKIKYYINADGWLDGRPCDRNLTNVYNRIFDECDRKFDSIRPKSLREIENNNGWTRIENIEDLPKEKVNCYFSGYNEITKEFYISELQERDNTRLQNLFESKYLTHIFIVNPTPKPKPPLYL